MGLLAVALCVVVAWNVSRIAETDADRAFNKWVAENDATSLIRTTS